MCELMPQLSSPMGSSREEEEEEEAAQHGCCYSSNCGLREQKSKGPPTADNQPGVFVST